MARRTGQQSGDSRTSPESTSVLLERVRAGDERAFDLLHERYAHRLRRWASGRLPAHARDGIDTQDLVQEAFVQSLRHIESFRPRWKGAFHGYLRQAILNKIRDQVRRAGARDRALVQAGDLLAEFPSPLAAAIGREALGRYESALAGLDESDRELVVARIEMDCTYEEIADLHGKASPDAARMAVKRALLRLAADMGDEHEAP